MKILHFTDSLTGGGKERQLNELVKSLVCYPDIESEIVTMNRPEQGQQFSSNGVIVHYLIRKTKKDPGIYIKFLQLCKQLNPNIIHVWDSMTAFYAIPAAKALKIKLINGMIRTAPKKTKFWYLEWFRAKLTFPFSDVIISNSRAGLKSFSVPSKKALCIHNGFAPDRILNLPPVTAIRKKFGINTPKIVGMVATFSKYKDYTTFLKAATLILKRRNDVTFVAVGDGDKMNHFTEKITSEYKNNIKCIGRQNKIESIINAFDIGVLSSHLEGLPNVIMEYMALSKPVVATNVGGVNELVKNNKTGFLVDMEDHKEMSEKILFLLANKQEADKMGLAGKEIIQSEFSLTKMINSYITLYRRFNYSEQ